jgi:hypothetical protein
VAVAGLVGVRSVGALVVGFTSSSSSTAAGVLEAASSSFWPIANAHASAEVAGSRCVLRRRAVRCFRVLNTCVMRSAPHEPPAFVRHRQMWHLRGRILALAESAWGRAWGRPHLRVVVVALRLGQILPPLLEGELPGLVDTAQPCPVGLVLIAGGPLGAALGLHACGRSDEPCTSPVPGAYLRQLTLGMAAMESDSESEESALAWARASSWTQRARPLTALLAPFLLDEVDFDELDDLTIVSRVRNRRLSTQSIVPTGRQDRHWGGGGIWPRA